MTLQMLNIDLLDRTMDFIEKHPDQHDQGNWRCGTSRCFAGWAAHLDGAKDTIPEDYMPYWKTTWRSEPLGGGERTREGILQFWKGTRTPEEAAKFADEMVPTRSDMVIPAGLTDQEKVDISRYAREALGLDSKSAELLFAGENTLEGLQEMVEYLKGEGTLEGSKWDEEDYDGGDDSDYCCEQCSGY